MSDDPRLVELAEFFPLNPQKFGEWNLRNRSASTKKEGNPLTLERLDRHVNTPQADGSRRPAQPVGQLPAILGSDGETYTTVGMFDFDGKQSPEHLKQAKADYRAVMKAIKTMGFHWAIATELSHSGKGYHIFVFLPKESPVLLEDMAFILKAILARAGVKTLETFPRNDNEQSVWYRLPYANAAAEEDGLGRTYLCTFDGDSIPYGMLAEYIDRSAITTEIIEELRAEGAALKATKTPQTSSSTGSGDLHPDGFGKLTAALLDPPQAFERHGTIAAALNVAERMGKRDEMLEFLTSEQVFSTWIKDGSRTPKTFAEEINRWVNADPPEHGGGFGLTFLRDQGFSIPSLPRAATNPAGPDLSEALTLEQALQQAEGATPQDRPAAAEAVYLALLAGGHGPVAADAALRDLAASIKATLKVVRDGRAEYLKRNAPPPAPAKTRGGSYIVHNGVICIEVYDGESQELVPVPLCNFTARITESVMRDDGAETTRHYTLEGSTQDGRTLHEVTIPARQFEMMHWPGEHWGELAIPYAGKGQKDHLRVGIQLISSPERRTVYAHSGWRIIDGQHVYLHAGGAIGASDEPLPVAVDLTGELKRFVLPAPPEREDAAAALRSSLALLNVTPDSISAPLTALPYRAAFGGANFGAHLVGQTGARKTQLAVLVQQHFGLEFTEADLPGSWTSTANYLEGLLFTAKDAVAVVDDFNPTGSAYEVARYHGTAERVFRAVGNQTGRGRMNAGGTLQETKAPRGMIVSTGEDTPKGHSLRARMLILEVKPETAAQPGDVDLTALTIAQQAGSEGVYAVALTGFIRWLAGNLDEHRERFTAKRHAERAELQRQAGHGRTADIAGQLLATWELIGEYARSIDAYEPAELDALLARTRQGVLDAMAPQAEHQAASDPVPRFLDLINALISSGKAHLATPAGECPGEGYGWRTQRSAMGSEYFAPQGVRLGWVSPDAGEVWLNPDTAYSEASRLADSQSDSIPTTKNTLWRSLAERGVIRQEGSGRNARNTIKRDVEGSRPRVLVMPSIVLFGAGLAGRNDQEGDEQGVNHRPARQNNAGRDRGAEEKAGRNNSVSAPENGARPNPENEAGREMPLETPSRTAAAPEAPNAPQKTVHPRTYGEKSAHTLEDSPGLAIDVLDIPAEEVEV